MTRGARWRCAWTPEEDRRLLLSWGPKFTMERLVAEFGRGRRALYDRAVELGLGNACPRGYEFVSQAARRTGFHGDSLRRILRWAGVNTFEALSFAPTKLWSRRYVDPERVDEAIAAWLATEPVECAARRHRVCGETLRRKLRDIGVTNAEGTRHHVRVTDAQLHQIGVAP